MIFSSKKDLFFVILAVAFLTSAASAEIHKCTDEFGNVAYLQTPCPAEVVDEPEAAEEEPVEPTPFEERLESTPEPQAQVLAVPSSRRADESLSDCKKRYRDQIDEIDDEMRATFTPEKGAEFKARLLVLTRQLRACK